MADVSLLFNIIGRDLASPALRKVGAEAEASAGGLGMMGKAMAGLAIVAIGVKAVKMAGDFQQSTNVLVTAAGEAAGPKGLGLVRKGILDLAGSTGTDWHALTDGMYMVEKAGYNAAHGGLDVLKAAAQGAREEGADLATVTQAMTSVMASYHLKATDSVSVMNQIKTAAGESKTTMESFAGALSTVLPVASANNISFAQVAGAMATLTQHGTSADETTQELSNTIRNLAAPNMVAVKTMQQLGIDSQDLSTKLGERGVAGTLNYLSQTVLSKMGPSGKVLLDTFTKSKSAGADMVTMLKNMSPATATAAKQYAAGSLSLKDWRSTLKAMPTDQANLASQFKTVADRANGFNSAIKAGMPGSQTYTKLIKDMTGGANGLNTTLQLTGESTAGTTERIDKIAAAAKGAGKDVDGWASTQKLFNVRLDMMKQKLEVVGIKLGTALMPPLLLVIGAVSRVAAVVGKFSPILGPLAAGLGSVAVTVLLVSKAMKLWTETQRIFNLVAAANPYVRLAMLVIAVGAALIYAYKHSEKFRAIVQATMHAVTAAASATWGWFKAHWPLLLSLLAGPFGLAVYEIAKHWQSIKTGAENVVSAVKGAFSGAGSWLIDAGRQVISGFVSGIADMFGSVKDTLGNLTSKLTSWKGPPAKDKTLLTPAGRMIIRGLIRGFEAEFPAVQQSLQGLTANIPASLKSSDSYITRVVSKMADAYQKAKDYAATIRQTFTSTSDLTSLTGNGEAYGAMTAQLRVQADHAVAFAGALTKLRKAHLNGTTMNQLIAAGPSQGLAAAENLLAGGKTGISTVNGLVAQINRAGASYAAAEAKRAYGMDPSGRGSVKFKAGRQHVSVSFDFGAKGGQDELITLLRKAIRVKGGNVQRVLGAA